ncbi:uncharacterized protein J3D65DRAFT_409145 [Phyllosticta citribraziliensis]|uniref:Glycine zipper domain-containing protein n=1 Tax=Phyllosticta citribraziliensis TaxID=989973 RepID=A0ABR1LM08_9PEZI
MAVLALKALSYGADKLPDKIFEALPGGYFKRKEEKLRKKEQKLRSQSEGRGRHRRSPSYSDEDDDYYSSDYYTSGDEFEREHRNRRKERRSDSSDEKDHRGRERERRRSHHGRLRSFDRYADEDIPPDLDPRAHSQGAEYYRTHFMPPQIQPYGQQQPPISAADEIYAHPQPHNPAAYTHAKPYNPAEYGHGQLNLPQTHAASNLPSQSVSPMTHNPSPNGHAISVQGQTVPVTHGQTVSPQNMTPQTQAQTNPASMQQNGAGYYGTSFPPPPPGSRSSRASSVDSRSMNQPYIPHSNLHSIPAKTATANGQASPYNAAHPPGSTPQFYNHTPAYMPQNSSPYLPNYNPYQQPASSSVSRHSSIHSSTNGGAHGGHGHHSRAKNESRRRHSIAVNTDPRLRSPYHPAYSRTAASSVTGSRQASRAPSRTGSNRNGVGERIQEGSGFDGARDYDSPRSVAAAGTLGAIAGGLVGDAFVPGAAVGTVLGAAAGGLGTSEVARRRLGRTYGGGRCDGAMRKSRREKGRNHSASVEDVTDEHFMG